MNYNAIAASTATNTISQSVRVKQGNENYDALVIKAAATVSSWPAAPAPANSESIATVTASNHYWDFM